MDGEVVMELEDVAPRLTQHESLFLEDGNIVLATDVHLYCVHKRVLAKHSVCFRERFKLPNCGAAAGELWNGNPLIKLDDVSDEDVYHLLKTFYDPRYYSPFNRTSIKIISSLLRMSTKFNVPTLRRNVLSHLGQLFPSAFEALGRIDLDTLFPEDELAQSPDLRDFDFQLLSLALDCNAKAILPMLYFECATNTVDFIFRATSRLPSHEKEKIIRGHVKLIEMSSEYASEAFAPLTDPDCESAECKTARLRLFKLNSKLHSVRSPIFTLEDLLKKEIAEEDEDLLADMCEVCSAGSRNDLEALRLRIWEEIPDIFGMGSWEEVTSE